MPSPDQSLDLLRQDIDSIDIVIHELIVKRGTIVEDIRKIKNGAGPALRPGREATIMRRLSAQHHGRFPLHALLCLWREMLGGFTYMQEPQTAAVYAPPENDRLIGVARNHYGSMTPLNSFTTASACVRAVVEHAAHVAVLPLPTDGEPESWWPLLMSSDEKAPKVVGRLPFLVAEGDEQALVVSQWARDLSASEASLIALRLSERTSRGKIMAAVSAAGFVDPVSLATTETEQGDCFHVIEVDGAVPGNDARLATLRIQLGAPLTEAHVVGGYARQMTNPSKSDRE